MFKVAGSKNKVLPMHERQRDFWARLSASVARSITTGIERYQDTCAREGLAPWSRDEIAGSADGDAAE